MTLEQHLDAYDWLLSRDPEALSVLNDLKSGCPELVDLLVQNLYGNLYQRVGLDLKSRLLITIACAASSGAMPQVTYQSRLALLCGVTQEELYEVLFNVAIFSGFSNAMNAMNAIKTAIATVAFTKEQSQQPSEHHI